MKRRRTILYVDDEFAAMITVLLQTHGYRVLRCFSEDQIAGVVSAHPVDLILLGLAAVSFDQTLVEVPSIFIRGKNHAQLLEDIRIALIRKRGPKPGVVAKMREKYAASRKASA
jgi:hypothetical protein